MTRTVPRPAATLPSVDLTPEQAAAIAVALAAQPDGPYAAHGRAALDKVLAALEPDPRRRGALRASSEVVRAEAGRSAALRSVVERGLAQRRVLVLHYRDAEGLLSRRQVEPQLLARTADRGYLVAWCRERQAPRWFRWDRIEAVELTTETAPRRDPVLFGAPSETHPAGRGRSRRPDPAVPRRALVVLPGGRQ
jgi:predicted DNA-binding transcriptional regulator YafY